MTRDEKISNRIEQISDKYILEILKMALKNDPENIDILFELGDLYTKSGFIKEGLEVDLKLSKLLPKDPTVFYNLACSYSLLGREEEAFKELRKAVALGYDDAEHMAKDKDLDNLKDDPRFIELLDEINRKNFFVD